MLAQLQGIIGLLGHLEVLCSAPTGTLPAAQDAVLVSEALGAVLQSVLAEQQVPLPQGLQHSTGVQFLARWLADVAGQLTGLQQLQVLQCVAALAKAGCGEWGGE